MADRASGRGPRIRRLGTVGDRQLFRRQLPPECGDFDGLLAEPHVCEPESPSDDPAVSKQSLDLIRVRGGADIEVLRSAPEKEITDAAADEVRDEAVLMEPIEHAEGVGVDLLAGKRVLPPRHYDRQTHRR